MVPPSRPLAEHPTPGAPARLTPRKGLVRLARDVAGCLHAHDLWLYAAGLTFYTAIAAVPLLLVNLTLAGLLIGDRAVAVLTERLLAYLPADVRGVVEVGVTQEMDMMLGGAALVAALLPASSYGEGLARGFGRFAPEGGRSRVVRGRLVSFVMLLVLQAATLGALAAVEVLPDILGFGFGARALGTYLTFLVGWGLSTVVLAVLYRLFTPLHLGAAAIGWTAAATGSFFTGMSMGWLLVLRFGVDLGLAYGGSTVVGTLVLAGVYLFAVQVVLLIGYVLALELEQRGGHPLRERLA